jgi:hypothetical protein
MTPNASEDESYDLPCIEAMLAGTLALMTGHAQSACRQQQLLMAQKIRSNLFFLGRHPGVSPAFRTVVERLHQHWAPLCQSEGLEASPTPLRTPLWHPPAERLQ